MSQCVPRAAQLAGAWHRTLGTGAGQRWVGQAVPPRPPLQCQLGASELQACRPGWQRGAQVSPWTQWEAGPGAGGGPLVRRPAAGGPGMAEAGGGKAEPPTCSPSPPGCTGPGHVLDGSARRPGVPSWTCCQLRKSEPHGSRLSCFVCGGKGSGQEGAVAGGPCRAPF